MRARKRTPNAHRAKLSKIAGVQQPSRGEAELALQIRLEHLPEPEQEYRFHAVRKWRFDFAWPDLKLAVEIEGVVGGEGGRHQRIAGFQGDLDKYDEALRHGWTVYRCSPKMVSSGRAIDTIIQLIRRLANVSENSQPGAI